MNVINQITGVLGRSLPVATALKALAGINPKVSDFIVSATTAGYPADMIVDFFNNLSESKSQKKQRSETEERVASGMARPDEVAMASERSVEGPKKALRMGAQLAGGLAGVAMGGGGQASPVPEAGQAGASAQQPEMGLQQAAQMMATPQPAPQQQAQLGHFERAMEGADYFSLPDDVIPSVNKIRKRLDVLQQQKVPYEDTAVQKIVKALKKLLGGKGIVEEERQRFEQGAPQGAAQQAPGQQASPGDSSAQFLQLIQEFKKGFNL